MKYKTKSIIIEAFRYNIEPKPEWFINKINNGTVVEEFSIYSSTHNRHTSDIITCEIKTLMGVLTVDTGDYIVNGICGEVYCYKPDIFSKYYDLYIEEE